MTDVLVIGGGIMGCAAAWKLALRGRQVTVLERAIPGAEASTAAAGILSPSTECWDQPDLWRLSQQSLSLYPSWEADLRQAGYSVDLRLNGVLHVAVDDHGEALHQQIQTSKVTCLSEVDTPHRSALLFPGEGSVDNRKLMTAVRAAAEQAGVQFVVGETVEEVLYDDAGCSGVRTQQRTWRAKQTLGCAGAWTGQLGEPFSKLAIRPIKGQMMSIRTSAAAPEKVTFAAGFGYLVPRNDRLIIGSTTEDVGFDRSLTAEGLVQLAEIVQTIAPQLSANPLLDTWCGFRPATPNHRPVIGALPVDGAWVASGHYRHGILLTPITAEILSAQMCGDTPGVDASAFSP